MLISKMRITAYTVAFALIWGILSSTDAQSVENELQSLCYKDGGYRAYEALLNMFPDFSRCFTPVMNEVLTEFQRSNGAIDYALGRFCGKAETLRKCVKTAMHTVKSCVGPHKHNTVIEVIYNVVASILKIACNDPRLLNTVFSRPGQECIDSKLQAVKYCVTKIIIGRNTTSHERLTPETDPLVMLSLLKNHVDSQDCSEVEDFERCSVNVLEECENPMLSVTLGFVYNYINHDIPCKDLPKLPKSEATPGSAVHALILSISVAIMIIS